LFSDGVGYGHVWRRREERQGQGILLLGVVKRAKGKQLTPPKSITFVEILTFFYWATLVRNLFAGSLN